VPYYEEARESFSTERVREAYSDANDVLPYLPRTLKSIVDEYSDDD